jgi:hypothetical protein
MKNKENMPKNIYECIELMRSFHQEEEKCAKMIAQWDAKDILDQTKKEEYYKKHILTPILVSKVLEKGLLFCQRLMKKYLKTDACLMGCIDDKIRNISCMDEVQYKLFKDDIINSFPKKDIQEAYYNTLNNIKLITKEDKK